MSTTPHRSPEPFDDAFGILASDEPATTTDAHSVDHDDGGAEPADAGPYPDGSEWGSSPDRDGSEWGYDDQTATWHAEPAADEEWFDDDPALVTPSQGTLYASGPGVPARGVVLMAGTAAAACAGLDLALTGSVGFFFDLCFVVICLVAAMAAAPRALFTVAVMPPLVFAVLIGVVALVAPQTIATGSFTAVFLRGLADHAVALCCAYSVALAVACTRGLAHRTAVRR